MIKINNKNMGARSILKRYSEDFINNKISEYEYLSKTRILAFYVGIIFGFIMVLFTVFYEHNSSLMPNLAVFLFCSLFFGFGIYYLSYYPYARKVIENKNKNIAGVKN